MLFLVVRKLMNNKWLVACLLAGSVITMAMVCCIPLYTGGVMQRMLTKDLENYQNKSGDYPGAYRIERKASSDSRTGNNLDIYRWISESLNRETADRLGLPYLKVQRNNTHYMTFRPTNRAGAAGKVYASINGITNYDSHITLIAGRLPANQLVDGMYEVIATAGAQKDMDIVIGEELEVKGETFLAQPMKIRVVGIYQGPSSPDVWWFDPISSYNNSFLMDYGLMEKEIIFGQKVVVSTTCYYALDYTKLKVENLRAFSDNLDAQKDSVTKKPGVTCDFPAGKILDEYVIRADQLSLTLWVLEVPILLMLAFYIFMVSQLIIENDRDEIAVINSRGASGAQIFGSYFLQSVLLSGVSLLAGPPLGVFICSVLGSSNGFLEFVSRSPIPLSVGFQTFRYALATGFFLVVMMMIPAAGAARVTIVEHKQKKARRWNAPAWQKMFLDVILLGISLYGLYQYELRQKTILVTEARNLTVPVDPFLFIISTAFVIGAGLLFLRLYPLLIRFISWAGGRFFPPVAHISFAQVGRSGGREQFLMLFLILTVSIGIFNANAARTINRNVADKVYYEYGADITLRMKWPNNIVAPVMAGPPNGEPRKQSKDDIIYREPDFSLFSKLDGTVAAARVFVPDEPTTINGKTGKLMAIVPNEFGQVVWSSPNLLPHHINDYLNLMAKSQKAVIVSTQLMKDLHLKIGDTISYRWGNKEVGGAIFAAVDYWPTFNPHLAESKYFVIANLKYVQARQNIEPYQIWYKCAPGATTKQVYDDISARRMSLQWAYDVKQDLSESRSDPLLQGTNGAMTLGFIVSLAISMIGFFIYWILSIKSRTLQFGILRAMGMGAGRVMLSLVIEQVMISGVAIFMGIIVGGVKSLLFVPLLGVVYGAAEQVPPFLVVASRADYLRLYAVVGVMLAAGLAILGVLVSRIRVTQAIKLGED